MPSLPQARQRAEMMKKLFNILYWTVLVAVLIIAGVMVLSTFNTPLKVRLFSVQSGSMEPAIHLGSLVVVKPGDNYEVGDVITARSEQSAKKTVTHRIIEVQEDKDLGRVSYLTKGDANEDPDHEPIPARRVIGKVVANIPFVGYPIAFAQTEIGFVVLIIIPATIIVYSEAVNIKKEVGRMIKARKKKAASTVKEETKKKTKFTKKTTKGKQKKRKRKKK